MRSVLHALYFRWQCGDLKVCTEGHSDVTKPTETRTGLDHTQRLLAKGPMDGGHSFLVLRCGQRRWVQRQQTNKQRLGI